MCKGECVLMDAVSGRPVMVQRLRSVTRNINVQNLACVFQVACVSGGGCKAQRTTISVHLLVCVCVSLEAINVQSLAYMFQSKRINQSAQLGEIMRFPLGTISEH